MAKGDFYKGEKKKSKKQSEKMNISGSSYGGEIPTFILPKMIEKKKPAK